MSELLQSTGKGISVSANHMKQVAALFFALCACGPAAPVPPGAAFPGDTFNPGSGAPARVVKTRVVNAFGPGGVKTARDLYVRQPSTGEFQRVASNLAYGDEAIFDAPVNALDSVFVYPVEVGTVPVLGTPTSMESDEIPEMNPSPITFILREPRASEAAFVSIVYQKFTDRAERNTPSAGKAGVVFLGSTTDGLALPSGYNMSIVGGACLPFADVFNDVRVDVDPGDKAFAWHDDSGSPQCNGPVIAQSPSISFAAGDAYFLVPLGETLAELTLKPFKMQR
jgi:hypothetical protein